MAGGYLLRRQGLRWGATDEEVHMSLPGDGIVPHPMLETTHAVIVRAGEQRLAVAVNHRIGQRELVTRALPPELENTAAVSGGAVLSDGNIALIVDCDALIGTGADTASTVIAA